MVPLLLVCAAITVRGLLGRVDAFEFRFSHLWQYTAELSRR